jgi:hypothetical protein
MWIKICCFLLLISSSAIGQMKPKVGFHSLNFQGFCDNREYFDTYNIPQTFFGMRVEPMFKAELTKYHSVYAGINGLKNFGSKNLIDTASLTAYFNYNNTRTVDFKIGSFSRQGVLTQYPLWMIKDSFNYFRPNVEGMSLKYHKNRLASHIWIDWLSLQSPSEREIFATGTDLSYDLKRFKLGFRGIMFHRAGTSIRQHNDYIIDNYYINPFVMKGFAINSLLDSISLELGLTHSTEVARGFAPNRTAIGFLGTLNLKKSWFEMNHYFYAGEGHQLNLGDAFYRAKMYQRNDAKINFLKKDVMQIQFCLSTHYVGCKILTQQRILVFFLL